MARAKTKDDVESVQMMDFERAVRLFRNDIKPAQNKVGNHAQEMSTAYKEIKKACGIPPAIARFCFKLSEQEEASRDVQLRALNGLLKQLGMGVIAADLVDQAQGNAGTDVIPAARVTPRPNLVVVPSDGSEADLAEAGGADPAPLDLSGGDPFETPPDELAKQAGRGAGRKGKAKVAEPAYGTGAAAIQAMNDAAATQGD